MSLPLCGSETHLIGMENRKLRYIPVFDVDSIKFLRSQECDGIS